MKRTLLVSALRSGLVFGMAFSLAVTAIITLRIWILNPGGIFHGPNGTNWYFLLETAWSWFAPIFVVSAVVAAGIAAARRQIMTRRRRWAGR